MAENFAKNLDDHGQDRPGQLFFAQLMILAGEADATPATLLKALTSFQPSTPHRWRLTAATDVREFLQLRIRNDQADRANREIEAAKLAEEARRQALMKAAQRRPAIEKQLFAVYWTEQGLRPKAVRDKWNSTHHKDSVGGGDAGRDDIKKAIQRGREFLGAESTSAIEMAALLGIRLKT